MTKKRRKHRPRSPAENPSREYFAAQLQKQIRANMVIAHQVRAVKLVGLLVFTSNALLQLMPRTRTILHQVPKSVGLVWAGCGLLSAWLIDRNRRRVNAVLEVHFPETDFQRLNVLLMRQFVFFGSACSLLLLPHLYASGAIALIASFVDEHVVRNMLIRQTLTWILSAAVSGVIGNGCFAIIGWLIRRHAKSITA